MDENSALYLQTEIISHAGNDQAMEGGWKTDDLNPLISKGSFIISGSISCC